MKPCVREILDQLTQRYPALVACRDSIEKAYGLLEACYAGGGKVLICGNGGSAADAEHIVGELMKGFLLKRPLTGSEKEKLKVEFPEDGEYLATHLQGALPAISLVSQSAISTAFINDVAADMVYAQQVYGYARPGDVVMGLSTSGNAKNVINALKVGKSLGAGTIGLTGSTGGKMKQLCDAAIQVPETETFKVQEYHLPVYHALCAMIENTFFYE